MEESARRVIYETGLSHILINIFTFLDGRTLESCYVVCKSWRGVIKDHFQRRSTKKKRSLFWKQEIPSGSRQSVRKQILGMQADHTSIILGMADGSAELWERPGDTIPMTRRLCFKEENVQTKPGEYYPLDLSPSYVLTGLNLWDRKTAKLLIHSTSYPLDEVASVLLNESESHIICLLTCGSVMRLRITLDSCTDTWVLEKDDRFQLSTCDISCMSLDGDFLFTGDFTGHWQFWNFSDGASLSQEHHPTTLANGHNGKISCCSLKYPIGISGSEDASAKIWNVEEKTLLRTLPHSVKVHTVAMNSCSFFTADRHSDLYIWDRKKCLDKSFQPKNVDDLLVRTLAGHMGKISGIVCRPTALLYSDRSGFVSERSYWKSIRNVNALRNFLCSDGINCMDCDGEILICGVLDKTVRVFHHQTFKPIHFLEGHLDHVWSVHLDQNFFVSGSWDGTTKVWKRPDGELFQTCEHPGRKEVNGVRIIRGKIFMSSLCGSVAVFSQPNLSSHFELQQEIRRPGVIYSLASDGEYLATFAFSDNSGIHVWKHSEDGNLILESRIAHESRTSLVWNMCITYPYLLCCRDDTLLDIYHIENGLFLNRLEHKSNAMCVAVCNGIAIVGCHNGMIAFWDLKIVLESEAQLSINHPACIKIISEHTGPVSSICVNMDELVSTDYNGAVILRKINQH